MSYICQVLRIMPATMKNLSFTWSNYSLLLLLTLQRTLTSQGEGIYACCIHCFHGNHMSVLHGSQVTPEDTGF